MRLIDADALLSELGECPYNWTDTEREVQEVNDWEMFRNMIDNAPTVQAKGDLISRQDAIDAWWHDEVFFGNQRDDMTKEQWLDYITDVISSLPSEVVMCKDCKWWNGNTETMHNNHLCRNWSKFGSIDVGADDFCSYGERREP